MNKSKFKHRKKKDAKTRWMALKQWEGQISTVLRGGSRTVLEWSTPESGAWLYWDQERHRFSLSQACLSMEQLPPTRSSLPGSRRC